MVPTNQPFAAELMGENLQSEPTNKLDDVLGGVGSVAQPGVVKFTATSTVMIKRIMMSHHESGVAFDPNKFGAAVLANGLKIVKVTTSGETSLIGETTIQRYTDAMEKGFKIQRDFEDSDWYQSVLDFEEVCGVYIRLRAGESIEVRNQDDISGKSHLAFAITGFVV